MARREPVQERGTASRDALLDAAIELLAERGLAGLSHRELARRSGLSRGMTTYFFASIDELARAAVERAYAARIDDYRATAAALATAEASTAELADAAAELFTSSSTEMLLAHFEMFLNAARRDDVRELLAPALASMRELALAAAARVGIEADEDRERLATAMIATIEGVELRRLAEGIDGRDELADALRLVAVGALAMQDDPDGWTARLAERSTTPT